MAMGIPAPNPMPKPAPMVIPPWVDSATFFRSSSTRTRVWPSSGVRETEVVRSFPWTISVRQVSVSPR